MSTEEQKYFGYLSVNKESSCELRNRPRRSVHGIVVLTNCRKLIVATIDTIDKEGVSFFSCERLDAYNGVPIKMDIMIYDALQGYECFMSDEPGWIVSSELLAQPPDESSRYRYDFRFFKMRSDHRMILERYFKERNGGSRHLSSATLQ